MAQPQPDVRVTIVANGPYVVSGAVPLARQTIGGDHEGAAVSWTAGEPIAAPPTYKLCRCGHSANKPFCDGTHKRIGFDGTEKASREPYSMQAKVLDGPTMRLSDAEVLCAAGRFCDPNGTVWEQVGRTDDARTRAMFIHQVCNCPSGRLVAWDKATGQPVEPKLPVSIGLVEDPSEGCSGPLWLRGGIPVVSSDGYAYEVRNRVTLCRCGGSNNKPFCDGTHLAIKFKA
jgi:CDGSH-type Zn-finger protein